jgi:hypothetical protein
MPHPLVEQLRFTRSKWRRIDDRAPYRAAGADGSAEG